VALTETESKFQITNNQLTFLNVCFFCAKYTYLFILFTCTFLISLQHFLSLFKSSQHSSALKKKITQYGKSTQ